MTTNSPEVHRFALGNADGINHCDTDRSNRFRLRARVVVILSVAKNL